VFKKNQIDLFALSELSAIKSKESGSSEEVKSRKKPPSLENMPSSS